MCYTNVGNISLRSNACDGHNELREFHSMHFMWELSQVKINTFACSALP